MIIKIGTNISHYHITEKLGAGGMGEVYLAEDTKLKRNVALKFLPQHLTVDKEAKERFEREAQAAAALNHPNIVTIYEIGEHDGQTYIAMEYVEGKTLRLKIVEAQRRSRELGKECRLKIEEITDIMAQICEGLAKAHKANIVHRDIKPENILIDKDVRVKILDFGLAKLKGTGNITKDTSTLGTVNYMSPEQAKGEDVDHRTDIWSLGVVLYEMLTGELPFKGEYESAVIYSILNEELKSIDNISTDLKDVVGKALCKNRDERYTSTEEFLEDISVLKENVIHSTSESKSTKTKKSKTRLIYITSIIIFFLIAIFASILFFPTSESEKSNKTMAVLPFTNLRSDPETNYLGDALAAEIIKDLAYLHNLNVLSFSAVRNLDDKSNLNVEYILTGNYLKELNIIRLNLELIKYDSQKVIWNEPVEEEFETSFKLMDKVSDKVINALSVKFSPEEQIRMRKDVQKNPIAYEYYLKALSYENTVEGLSMAINMLNKSIQIDSTYAPAFTELGYRTMMITEVSNDSYGWKKAEEYFRKALNINSEDFTAITHLAMISIDIIGDTEEAMDLMAKASKINPHNATTYFRYSYIYRHAGLLEKSEEYVERALNLEPNNPKFQTIRQTYIYLEKYNKALEACNIIADNPWRFAKKGEILLRMGNEDDALEFFNKIGNKCTELTKYFADGYKAYILGNRKEGLKITKKWEMQNPFSSELLHWITCLYSLHGDKKSCVRVLKRSIDAGFFNYPFFRIDPFLDPVRDDPEFQEVLALAKEKHEAFKHKYFAE